MSIFCVCIHEYKASALHKEWTVKAIGKKAQENIQLYLSEWIHDQRMCLSLKY
jgi:hypothetical protein